MNSEKEGVGVKIGYIGLLLVLMKMGGKLIPVISKCVPVLFKALKGLLGFKTIGAVGSLGLYSLIFSWQMAVSLVAFILIHEYGHLWAMKKCGVKTKGVYLIPGFGGVAMAAEGFKSGRNEAFIALMGPLVGLLFIAPAIALYFVMGDPIFAAIASIMALINLFNLFPINPLDGGRVVKSLFYSFRGSLGFFFSFFSLAMAAVIGWYTGLTLIIWIAALGFWETLSDYGLRDTFQAFTRTMLRCLGFYIIKITWEPLSVFWQADSLGWQGILLIAVLVIIGCFLWDVAASARREERTIFVYPYIVLKDCVRGAIELFSVKPRDLKRVENYAPMNSKQIWFYGFLYLLTAAGMVALVWYTGNIPGCQLAKETLT